MPVVIRIPYGGGIGAVEHHASRPRRYFAPRRRASQVVALEPGRRLQDDPAGDRLDPDPVLFFEPKRRYWEKGEVDPRPPAPPPTLSRRSCAARARRDPAGSAPIVGPAHAADAAEADGARSLEVIDLRSLCPAATSPDRETRSGATGRLVVVHEAPAGVARASERIAARSPRSASTRSRPRSCGSPGSTRPYPPSQVEEEYLPDRTEVLDPSTDLRYERSRRCHEPFDETSEPDRRVPCSGVRHARRRGGPHRGRGAQLAGAVGDKVAVNQIIVEVETAKAAVELPCPYAGTVQAPSLVEAGETVEVGTRSSSIDTGGRRAIDAPCPSSAGPAARADCGRGRLRGSPSAGRDGRSPPDRSEAAPGRVATRRPTGPGADACVAQRAHGATPATSAVRETYGGRLSPSRSPPPHRSGTLASRSSPLHSRRSRRSTAVADRSAAAIRRPRRQRAVPSPSPRPQARPRDLGVRPAGVITRYRPGGHGQPGRRRGAATPAAARDRRRSAALRAECDLVNARETASRASARPPRRRWWRAPSPRRTSPSSSRSTSPDWWTLRDRLQATARVRRRQRHPAGVRGQGGLPGRPARPRAQLQSGTRRRGEIVCKRYVHLGIAAAHSARPDRAGELRDAEQASTSRPGHGTQRADRDSTGRQDPAGRHDRGHLHDHQRRRLRCRHRHADHQPRRGGDPGARRDRDARRGWSTGSSRSARCASWRCRSTIGWSTVRRDPVFLADVGALLTDPGLALAW